MRGCNVVTFHSSKDSFDESGGVVANFLRLEICSLFRTFSNGVIKKFCMIKNKESSCHFSKDEGGSVRADHQATMADL